MIPVPRNIREKILLEKPTSFDAAVNLAKAFRNTKLHAKELSDKDVY